MQLSDSICIRKNTDVYDVEQMKHFYKFSNVLYTKTNHSDIIFLYNKIVFNLKMLLDYNKNYSSYFVLLRNKNVANSMYS